MAKKSKRNGAAVHDSKRDAKPRRASTGKTRKRAFLVVGPESSGTRFITRALIAAGCNGVATAYPRAEFGGWPQKWDRYTPKNEPLVVLRHTLPYHPFRKWYSLDDIIDRFQKAGYTVQLVVCERKHHITAKSQVKHGYIHDTESAMIEINRAYTIIYDVAHRLNLEYFTANYEQLVKDPDKRFKSLMDALELKFAGVPEEIIDGNAKYEKGKTNAKR